ncbi:hypothetical protein A3D14_00495 [Candidatus Saccharibacteria bacterium RIFCSPHIGHO2_02_FULL_47_12]|nr:MAG: hypothetical protein A3D14_00495 [Candidatus Saccharibacteria bacterium RIFCSPHIGHO2_02_FULL_47_12]
MAILLSYLFYFIAASASPLQRRWLATKKDGGGQIDFAFRVMLITAIGGLSLVFFSPFQLRGKALELGLLALVCAVSGAAYFVSYFSAQKHVDAGVSTLVSNVYTPVTIVIATLFLNEGLEALQIIGTLFLLFAMLLVSKKHRLGKFSFDKYFWLVVISGIALGICLSAERALMKTTGFTAGTLLSWWSQVAGLGIASYIWKSHTTYNLRDTAITGGLRFLQALSWVILLQVVGNLSVVSSVTTFKVVVVFAAAAIILKERQDMTRKIIGSIIAVVGLLLMK